MKKTITKNIKHQIQKLDILLNANSNNVWKFNYYAVSGFWNKKPLLNIDTIISSLTKIQRLIYKIFENKGNILVLNQWADVKDIYQKLFCNYPFVYSNTWIPGQISNFYQIQKPNVKNDLVFLNDIDLIFNLDLTLTNTAINEIKNEKIVFVSLTKTHSRSKNITYKIPSNSENLRSSLFFSLFLNKVISKPIIKNSVSKKKYILAKLISRKLIIKRHKIKKVLFLFKKRKKYLSIVNFFSIKLSPVIRFSHLKILRSKGNKWLRKERTKWLSPRLWKLKIIYKQKLNNFFRRVEKTIKTLSNSKKKNLI